MRQYLTSAAAGENVTISGKALTDTKGEATLIFPFHGKRCANNTGSLEGTDAAAATDHVRVTVSAGRLDDEPIENVGFVKIDVEAHERSVLAGARDLILQDRPAMLVEILPEPTPRHLDETIEQIESFGYETFVMLGSRLVMLRSLAAGEDCLARRASNNFIFLPTGRKAA